MERRTFVRWVTLTGASLLLAAADVTRPKQLRLLSNLFEDSENLFLSKLIAQRQFTIIGESPHHVRNYKYIAEKIGILSKSGQLSHAVFEWDGTMAENIKFFQSNPAFIEKMYDLCSTMSNDPAENFKRDYCHYMASIIQSCLENGTQLHCLDRLPPLYKTVSESVRKDDEIVTNLLMNGRFRECEAFIKSLSKDRLEELNVFEKEMKRQRDEENAFIAKDIQNEVGQERTLIFYGDAHAKALVSLFDPQKVTYIRFIPSTEFESKRNQFKPRENDLAPDLIRCMETSEWIVTPEGKRKGYDNLFGALLYSKIDEKLNLGKTAPVVYALG